MYVDLCIEYSLGSCIHRGATVNRDLLWACLAYQWDRMSDDAKALMVECANIGPKARYQALAEELFGLELMYSWDSEQMDAHLDRMDVEWDAMTADERASMELDPRAPTIFFQEQQLWSTSSLSW